MSNLYAVVDGEMVINTVLWDGPDGADPDWTPDDGDAILVQDGIAVSAGWSYNGSEFIPPPELGNESDNLISSD